MNLLPLWGFIICNHPLQLHISLPQHHMTWPTLLLFQSTHKMTPNTIYHYAFLDHKRLCEPPLHVHTNVCYPIKPHHPPLTDLFTTFFFPSLLTSFYATPPTSSFFNPDEDSRQWPLATPAKTLQHLQNSTFFTVTLNVIHLRPTETAPHDNSYETRNQEEIQHIYLILSCITFLQDFLSFLWGCTITNLLKVVSINAMVNDIQRLTIFCLIFLM